MAYQYLLTSSDLVINNIEDNGQLGGHRWGLTNQFIISWQTNDASWWFFNNKLKLSVLIGFLWNYGGKEYVTNYSQ